MILVKEEQHLEAAIKATDSFLAVMGLEINQKKTKTTHSDNKEGFLFLGCQVRQIKVGKYAARQRKGYDHTWKVIITPSKKTVDQVFNQIRQIAKTADIHGYIEGINSIISGFIQFAKDTDAASMGEVGKWDTRLYLITRAWLKRTRKVYKKDPKFWKKVGNRDWVLYAKKKEATTTLRGFYPKGITYSSNNYIKVKGEYSPYNGDWPYWGTRNTTNAKESDRKLKLLRKQRGRCTMCKQRFYPNDIWEVDHIVPRKNGGQNTLLNTQLLHKECHEKKTHGRTLS